MRPAQWIVALQLVVLLFSGRALAQGTGNFSSLCYLSLKGCGDAKAPAPAPPTFTLEEPADPVAVKAPPPMMPPPALLPTEPTTKAPTPGSSTPGTGSNKNPNAARNGTVPYIIPAASSSVFVSGPAAMAVLVVVVGALIL